MGRLSTGQRKNQIQELWDYHREINRRLVSGQNQKDIARDMGITEAKVSYTKNSAVAQRDIGIMRGARDAISLDISVQIREVAPEALEVLTDIMNGDDNPKSLRAKVAIDLLDRAGYAPPKKVAHAIMHKHFTSDDLNEIKERAKEVGTASGVVVDDTIEEA